MLKWMDVWQHIDKKKSVVNSSYRTTSGSIIAKPYIGLSESWDNKNSLTFIKRNDLLESFDLVINNLENKKVIIRKNEIIKNISKTVKGIEMKTTKNETLITNLLIAADGQHSNIRSILYPKNDYLSYGGYIIYRGYTKTMKDKPEQLDGFQTWGVGSRFACVPTYDGNVWFATIQRPPLLTPMDVKSKIEDMPSYVYSGYIQPNMTLVQGNKNIEKQELDELISHFKTWHKPISELIAGTNLNDITVCNSFSYNECMPNGLSGLPFPDATLYKSLAKETDAGVAFVGDAAHTLDPILAHGAGIAIEDAALLNMALHLSNESETNGKVETILETFLGFVCCYISLRIYSKK